MTKPDAKNLFRGLDEKVTPKLAVSTALAPVRAAETPAQAQRQRSRQGKKVVTYYLDPEPFMQLKVLAAKTGLTVQELNVEGLNLLFEKHQVSRIA